MAGYLVLGVMVILVVWAISVYNMLVQLKIRSDNAWADIDVQLKRRYDLVPNIVAAVEGYAKHEKSTLMAVVEARTKAIATDNISGKNQTENVLTTSLRSLFAVAENYPDLKANENFLKLQTSLIDIEETIQSARRYYNAVVRDLNTLIQMFPSSLIANAFHFQKYEFFQLNAPDVERQVPQVSIETQN